jgi:hypothetical protein
VYATQFKKSSKELRKYVSISYAIELLGVLEALGVLGVLGVLELLQLLELLDLQEF